MEMESEISSQVSQDESEEVMEQDDQMSNSESEKENKNDNVINEEQLNNDEAYAQFLPQVQETDNQPPLLVIIQGPDKSGKTTLLNSLVSNYLGQKIKEINGSITINTSKTNRVTFIECPNTLQSFIDLSKVADLSLCIMDASMGFSMELLEYICLLKQNGMTNVMGVLTHMDYYKDNKGLRKSKKKYKTRFQVEVGKENKLFYFSKLINNQYPANEIANLCRFISVMKRNPNSFQQTNPYLLIDKFEIEDSQINLQPEQQVNCTFQGYIRGCSYRNEDNIHLVGLGNYPVEEFTILTDPCPVEKTKAQKKSLKKGVQNNQQNQFTENRTLKKEQKKVHAPHTNLGYLNFDHTGGYITIPEEQLIFTKKPNEGDLEEGVQMVRDLQQYEQHNQIEQEDADLLDGVKVEKQEVQVVQQQQVIDKPMRTIKKSQNNIMYKLQQNTMDYNNTLQEVNLQEFIYQSGYLSQEDTSRYDYQIEDIDKENLQIYKSFFMAGNQINDEQIQKEQIDFQLEDHNFKPLGSYVKFIVPMEYSIFQQLSPQRPVIITKPSSQENNFLKCKLKKHRWYPNVLKSRDPLIFSIGFKRFQSIPYFCVEDLDVRTRFVKYTPEHEYCHVVFYGIPASLNQNILCCQTMNPSVKKFRISATGFVLEQNKTFQIQKKLKLIGEPFKIYKNSAFIKNMFNSKLEVAKYEGAKIRTVSKIRGQIKKAVTEGKDGCFRATFEDKIVMSDIVFLITWFNIPLEKFYNPVVDFQNVRLMKTTWELRKENNKQVEVKKDSQYKEIERVEKKFNPLLIPKSLENALPFKTKEKFKEKTMKEKINAKEKLPVKSLMDEEEKKAFALIQRLNTIKRQKVITKQKNDAERFRIKAARNEGEKKKYEVQKKEYKKNQAKIKFGKRGGKK